MNTNVQTTQIVTHLLRVVPGLIWLKINLIEKKYDKNLYRIIKKFTLV